jgi:hypothetical protein
MMAELERIKIRSAYNYDRNAVSWETGVDCPPEEDKAVQSYAREVDINELVKRFGITGDIPVAKELAEYGDFSEVVDFQTAMEQLRRGAEAFESIPPLVRKKFNNDPGEFWLYLQTAETEALVELGFIDPSQVPSNVDGPAAGAPGSPGTPDGDPTPS